MQEVITEIDQGPAVSRIQIGTTGMTGATPPANSILVSIELQDPSFVESNGVITMETPGAGVGLSGQATQNGNAHSARILNGNNVVVVAGLSVGLSTTTPPPQIILNALAISDGQMVTLSSGTIEHSYNTGTWPP
jgi:hypothetical protein